MSQTAFIVRVPEAEALVAGLRRRFDPTFHLGVPAHITILSPFMAPDRIMSADIDKIESILRPFPAFDFRLGQVARFPLTTYLAPEPPTPFIALTEALVSSFPEFPPFGGLHPSIVPHLTVAHGHADAAHAAAVELEAALRARAPVRGRCASIVLLENSTGTWRCMREFALRADVA